MAKLSKPKPSRKPPKAKKPTKRERELIREVERLKEQARREKRNAQAKLRRIEQKRRKEAERFRRSTSARKGQVTKFIRQKSIELRFKESRQDYLLTAQFEALADLARELGYSAKRLRDELFSPKAKGKK